VIRGRKGEYREVFNQFRKEGYVRVRVDGVVRSLDDDIVLNKNKKHTLDVIIDRLVVGDDIQKRLTDSIELALKQAAGMVIINNPDNKEDTLYSEHFACVHCNISYEDLAPRMFSFNSPYGACPTCDGLGTITMIDPKLLIMDESLSIRDGALIPLGERQRQEGWNYELLKSVADEMKFSLSTPWKDLSDEQKRVILYGTGHKRVKMIYKRDHAYVEWMSRYEGLVNNLNRRYRQTRSQYIRDWIEGFMNNISCHDCEGARLRKEALSVTINDKNIKELTTLSIREIQKFFENIKLSEREALVAHQILKEVKERLSFLVNVGLDYLTLDRAAGTLSGGEAQRIRLATQIGAQLVGVLYILDEPSIGLHQRDNSRLIETLQRLRDLGNTVLVVEHDRETIERSDFVVDLGPRAGKDGGNVVFSGTPQDILHVDTSITGAYLSGREYISIPSRRRNGNGRILCLSGARGNNLKNITIEFPLGTFICITGVSGSGKSSLINETLYAALARHFYKSKLIALEYNQISGLEYLDKVINIDQSPIGRTPRSNPATYTGLFTPIRDLFTQLPESKIRGYKPGRYSFNVKGGRCEVCEGDGIKKIEMHFLPDVYVQCEVCKGKRYNRETLQITYRGKNIADVLEMTVNEALEFFQNIPQIKRRLQTLAEVGLGYIHLGQSATTLSGGEAQRVKLATELSKIGTGNTLYLLDEPTTGLHFEDIKMLLNVLNKLVDKGNTVIIIEHNMDVIKTADFIIDLGPEGGDNGGEIIVTGTPEEVQKYKNSYTGHYLRKELRKNKSHI